jgi:hypothetical protein
MSYPQLPEHGDQQPPTPPPYYPPVVYQQPVMFVAAQPTSGLATASLVCGILGLIFGWCLFGIPSLIAVVLGHMGLAETKNGTVGGRGSAIAGLILGYLVVAPSAIITVMVIASMAAGG